MTSRVRRWSGNLALAAGSTLSALVLLEGVVRLLGAGPTRFANTARIHDARGRLLLDCYPENPRQAFDVDLRDAAVRERYRAAGLARVDAVAARAPFAVEFRYNALGFRDVEWRDKPAGVHRVIVLGDSFTEGWGVREPDTYPRVLERTLEAAEPGHWEVRNAGRRGADFPPLFDAFEQSLAFHPDLLVYGMVLNDVDRAPEIDARQSYLNDWIFDQARLSSGRPLPHTRWRLLALVEDRVSCWRIDRASTRWYRDLYGPPNASGWTRTQDRLVQMQRRLAAQGGRFMVASWPLLVGLDGRYPFQAEHDRIARFCEGAGIARQDLLPVLRGRPNADLVVHAADRHPSALAHRLVGEALAPTVRALFSTTAATSTRQGTSQQPRSVTQAHAASTPSQAASRDGSSRSPSAAGSARAIRGTPMRPSSPRTVPEASRTARPTRKRARKRRDGSSTSRPRRINPTDTMGAPRNTARSSGLNTSHSA
jgi:hypothetical protein